MDKIDIKEIYLCAGIIVLFVVMLGYYIKTKRRFVKLFAGVLCGIGALYPAGFIVAALGGVLQLNVFTASVSALLGIPGVLMLSAASLL